MFRRSGSAVTYYVSGDVADFRSPSFTEALADHRFRGIENAASEESSVGWVTPGDPTGDTFELEHMDLDVGIWLRMRMDRKKLPTVWLKIHRAQAEREAGRKLSARERKELRDDLHEKLLPRVLPAVAFIDALYAPKSRTVLLFGTSTRVRDEFHKLFFRTFGADLSEADPAVLAAHVGLDRETLAYLDQVSPVRWPSRPRREREVAEPALAGAVGEMEDAE